MDKVWNGQIVEWLDNRIVFYLPKTYFFGHTCLLVVFFVLTIRSHFVMLFMSIKKCFLTKSTLHQFEHSSIQLCISDTRNAELFSTRYEELRKFNDSWDFVYASVTSSLLLGEPLAESCKEEYGLKGQSPDFLL